MAGIGMIGLGTVGSGVYEILTRDAERLEQKTGLKFEIKKIIVKDLTKERLVPKELLSDNPAEVLENPDVDIIVELMSGDEAKQGQYILAALESKKHVVTAGKAAVAKYWKQISQAATENQRAILFEASVGGVMPVMQLLNYLRSNVISQMTGILNGTTNYMLTRMNEGTDYEEALKLATEKGYAEVPPDLDVNGDDASSKIAILASKAFGTWVDPNVIYKEGITKITPIDFRFAKDRGYAIKLLATAKLEGRDLEVSVNPAMTQDEVLSSVNEATNAVQVVGSYSGPVTLVGKGAGKEPTATAVVHDIVTVASNLDRNIASQTVESGLRINQEDFESKGYFRVMLKHEPGALAEAAAILGENRLSIAETAQYTDADDPETRSRPWFFVTEPAPRQKVNEALSSLRGCDKIAGEPFYMRVQ